MNQDFIARMMDADAANAGGGSDPVSLTKVSVVEGPYTNGTPGGVIVLSAQLDENWQDCKFFIVDLRLGEDADNVYIEHLKFTVDEFPTSEADTPNRGYVPLVMDMIQGSPSTVKVGCVRYCIVNNNIVFTVGCTEIGIALDGSSSFTYVSVKDVTINSIVGYK